MDKIILKDGTRIEIEESSNGGSFRKQFVDPQEYLTTLAKLTQNNLSAYQVQNAAGLTCANPENKECLSQEVTALWAENGAIVGLDVIFHITDVDLQARAIKDLQASQEVQDGAIVELAEIVAGGEA